MVSGPGVPPLTALDGLSCDWLRDDDWLGGGNRMGGNDWPGGDNWLLGGGNSEFGAAVPLDNVRNPWPK